MENISKTMNELRNRAEKFDGERSKFWSGQMSMVVVALTTRGIGELSNNISLLDEIRREYDSAIFAETLDRGKS